MCQLEAAPTCNKRRQLHPEQTAAAWSQRGHARIAPQIPSRVQPAYRLNGSNRQANSGNRSASIGSLAEVLPNVQVGESVALALVREEAGETLNDALCPERVVRGAHRTDDIIFQPDVNEALCT